MIDSSILFLTTSHRYFGDESWWNETQRIYNLSKRPISYDSEFDYYDQMISQPYFLFLFSSFEHSIRQITQVYNVKLYNSQKNFSPIEQYIGNGDYKKVNEGIKKVLSEI